MIRSWLASAGVPLLLLSGLAQAGDAKRGAEIFEECASCHAVGPEARTLVGPHLNGIFGRRAGSLDGFDYSDDIRRAGVTGLFWTAEKLDIYLEDPRSLVSGTRMLYRGLAEPADRADVIAFLRLFSDNPRDIPEAAPTAVAAPHDPSVAPEILALDGDPAYGEYLSGECVTCHQPDGQDKGIPSIAGWPREVFVTAMHAYKSKARINPVMRMIAGPLSDEEIAALAAYFEAAAPE